MRSPGRVFLPNGRYRVTAGTSRFNSGLGLASFAAAGVDLQRKFVIGTTEEKIC